MLNKINRKEFISITALGSLAQLSAVRLLAKATGVGNIADFVNYSYRMVNYKTLLNLEFYFIGVNKSGTNALIKCPGHDSFMIVRLPQQHVAETYFTDIFTSSPCNVLTVQTRIAGYSFLVFQIFFEADVKKYQLTDWITEFVVDADYLLGWNKKYLKLIVREDRGTTNALFDKTNSPNNSYPFGYNSGNRYDPNYFPKLNPKDQRPSVYNPSVFTVIEVPYRLFLSPELPNHLYKFRWTFSSNADINGKELWMATLTIIPDPLKNIEQIENKVKNKNAVAIADKQKNVDKTISEEVQMQLAIVGTPDCIDGSLVLSRDNIKMLPTPNDRYQLQTLYNLAPHQLLAKTIKLAFTPLGICGTLEFNNTLIQQILLKRTEKDIDLFQWKQAISFGRDQEVQVVNLIKIWVGCNTSLMLHVRTTKRITYHGVSILNYEEYLLPLESSKQLLIQNDNGTYVKTNYPCNTPFKSIKFATLKAKQILPLAKCSYSDKVESNNPKIDKSNRDAEIKNGDTNKQYIGFWAKTPEDNYLEWDFIATDWQGVEHSLTSRLFLISCALTYTEGPKDVNFKLPDLGDLNYNSLRSTGSKSLIIENIDDNFTATLNTISATALEWHQIYQRSEQYLLEKADIYREHLENIFSEIDTAVARVFDNERWRSAQSDFEERIKEFKGKFYGLIKDQSGEISDYLDKLKNVIVAKLTEADDNQKRIIREILYYCMLPYKELEDVIKLVDADVLKAYYDLKGKIDSFDAEINLFIITLASKYGLNAILSDKLKEVKHIYCFLEHVETTVKSLINTYKSKIGIAAYKAEQGLDDLKKDIQNKLKDAWAPVYNTVENYYHQANREITAITTTAIMFKSNAKYKLDSANNKVLDFFDYNGISHQVSSIHGKIERINQAVNKDLTVRFNYPKQYLENQFDLEVLEVKNNARQVVAQFHAETKEAIKGAMREINHELGGMVNPELASDLLCLFHDAKNIENVAAKVVTGVEQNIQDASQTAKDLEDQFTKEFKALKENVAKQVIDTSYEIRNAIDNYKQKFKDQFDAQKQKLVLIQKNLTEKVNQFKEQGKEALKNTERQVTGYIQSLEAKIIGSIKLKDILGIDAKAPCFNRTNKSIYYNFNTDKFVAFSLPPAFSFKPQEGKTNLNCYFEKSLTDASAYTSQTKLENFAVGVFDERLEIQFRKLEISSNRDEKNKVSVQIENVAFKKELAFLDALSKNIKVPGTGILLNITPIGIQAKYTFSFPSISGGAFTMANLKFGVGLRIPFPIGGGRLKPIEVSFGINAPDDKFVVAASIFGGRGHFVLTTTPHYVSGIDCSIEFGGYLGLNLGIASGEAYLMAGIRYVYTRDDEGESSMQFYAYITCGGSLTVFGFISISACFILCLTYKQTSDGRSSLVGTASLSLSVKIGFFEKSFTLTFTKTIAGTDNPGVSTVYNPLKQLNEAYYTSKIPDNNDAHCFHYAKYTESDDDPPPKESKSRPLFTEAGWRQYCKSFF